MPGLLPWYRTSTTRFTQHMHEERLRRETVRCEEEARGRERAVLRQRISIVRYLMRTGRASAASVERAYQRIFEPVPRRRRRHLLDEIAVLPIDDALDKSIDDALDRSCSHV